MVPFALWLFVFPSFHFAGSDLVMSGYPFFLCALIVLATYLHDPHRILLPWAYRRRSRWQSDQGAIVEVAETRRPMQPWRVVAWSARKNSDRLLGSGGAFRRTYLCERQLDDRLSTGRQWVAALSAKEAAILVDGGRMTSRSLAVLAENCLELAQASDGDVEVDARASDGDVEVDARSGALSSAVLEAQRLVPSLRAPPSLPC